MKTTFSLTFANTVEHEIFATRKFREFATLANFGT